MILDGNKSYSMVLDCNVKLENWRCKKRKCKLHIWKEIGISKNTEHWALSFWTNEPSTTKNIMGTLIILKTSKWKRQAPYNYREPFNELFVSFRERSISPRKDEMEILVFSKEAGDLQSLSIWNWLTKKLMISDYWISYWLLEIHVVPRILCFPAT